jgi:hypothetical protein
MSSSIFNTCDICGFEETKGEHRRFSKAKLVLNEKDMWHFDVCVNCWGNIHAHAGFQKVWAKFKGLFSKRPSNL